MNNDPPLHLHKCFLGFNLTYMNITDYQLMQSLNAAHLTPAQPKKLSHKLPNYSMVNYDSLKEQIQQIDENYPFAMLTWLKILIMVLSTVMTAGGIAAYCYCKYR